MRIIDTERICIATEAARLAPWRIALRRTLAYLAIRLDPAWLDASCDVLEGYLPPNWQYLAHHELVTYLDVQGITPEHCILA
jgi:hypothetical protein